MELGDGRSHGLIRQPERPEVPEHALGVAALGDLGEGEALVVLTLQQGEQLAPGVVLVGEVAEVDLVHAVGDQGERCP